MKILGTDLVTGYRTDFKPNLYQSVRGIKNFKFMTVEPHAAFSLLKKHNIKLSC